ncbi:elongation factor EF-1 gamma subunit [Extremus antarcticus]|uniref:Elongation factor EF-1 gamma subunit n=1 Tax=Extremus antarcticus TaxID=702011 RepID=A0AAJ0D5K9_9PEZI|nr:elongation factor EF-1 gamma subunit [Extremus antarcticus]
MAMGTLYYNWFKPRSIAIRVLAKLLDLDLDFIHINGSEDAGAAYLALNPLGKIPTYVDQDGFVLTECTAVLTYIATQYQHKKSLLGANQQEYFKVQQWLSFANSELLVSMGGALYPIMKDFKTEIVCDADDCARMLLRELQVLDDHLAGRTYLVGESLTIADLLMNSFIGCGIQVFHQSWWDDYPNIARWFLPIYNLPENKAVAGELAKFEKEIPPALQGKKAQRALETAQVDELDSVMLRDEQPSAVLVSP